MLCVEVLHEGFDGAVGCRVETLETRKSKKQNSTRQVSSNNIKHLTFSYVT